MQTLTNSRMSITKAEIRELIGGGQMMSKPTFNRHIRIALSDSASAAPFTENQWFTARNYVPWNWYLWICENV